MARALRPVAIGLLLAAVTTIGGSAQNQGTPAATGSQGQQGAQGSPGAQGASGTQGQQNSGSSQGAPDSRGGQAQSGQGQAAQTPRPTFRTGIDFVRVDVIVSDKAGNTVADLKPTDFEIVEDGKLQTVETFKLIELDGGLMPGPDGPPREIRTDFDEESEAARDDVRLFGIFLDDYHVRQGTSMSARQQIARFIETQLGPSDMVGLMYPLQPVSTIRFSRAHDRISGAVQQFLGRKFDYTPKNEIEEKYAYYPTETVERIRNQVSLSAIEGMIVHMGTLKEGRKALLLVSEGYSNMLPPQMRNQVATMPGIGNPAAGNPLAGANDPNETRAAFIANTDLLTDMREIFAAANRNNVAIYPVDPRGLATNEFGIDENIVGSVDRDYLSFTQNTLRQFAEESDGRAIVNRNDITMAMKQIVKDSSAYYLLGYTSTVGKSDGKFHDIKVRVKRPGVVVRARKGYWALTPDDAKRVLAGPKPDPPKAVETALSAINVPSRSRVVRTWIGTERGPNGTTHVTFVWEPAPRTAGEPTRPTDLPARVSVTATKEDGSPAFRGRVPEGLPGAPVTTPMKVSFDVTPGKLQLRMAVESFGADTLDSEVRELTIPDLTAPQTFLGTPQVFRARTVRDAQQIRNDANAPPTVAREFSRTDRLLIKVVAYGPGTTPPVLTARLLNRTGQAMSEVPVTTAADGQTPLLDVSLAGFAPGEYLIELAASGSGGDAKELVGFRITG
jgi:VWFA-related protein